MVTKRLTEKAVGRLRGARIVWDAQEIGLGLKITPAGSRIWILQLVYPGQKTQSRRTLGTYPSLSVSAARAKARKWYGLVKQGIDPSEAEEAERERQEAERRAKALKSASSFAAFAEVYIAERANNRRAKLDAQEIHSWFPPGAPGRSGRSRRAMCAS